MVALSSSRTEAFGINQDFRADTTKKRIIADELSAVLRNHMNAVEKFNCQREASFSELFAVLEDKDSQDVIRKRASEVKHCRWLRKNPNACASFVEEILDKDGNPTVRKGDPCPNNPIHKHPEIYEMEYQNLSVISEVRTYEDMIWLNVLPSIEELTPAEFAVCSVLRGYMTAEEQKSQMLIRQTDMGQMMGGIFGGTEGKKGRGNN
jgi:hypothetical protein